MSCINFNLVETCFNNHHNTYVVNSKECLSEIYNGNGTKAWALCYFASTSYLLLPAHTFTTSLDMHSRVIWFTLPRSRRKCFCINRRVQYKTFSGSQVEQVPQHSQVPMQNSDSTWIQSPPPSSYPSSTFSPSPRWLNKISLH